MADLIIKGDLSLLNPQDRENTGRIDIMSLALLNQGQLRHLRNTILAQYGYIFKSEDLQQYFSQFDWYAPKSNNVDSLLTEMDRHNIERIRKFEHLDMMSKGIFNNDDLVGVWHTSPLLAASAFHSVYQFYQDGRFSYHYDQTRELPVIRSFSGKYDVWGNTLLLFADSKKIFTHSDDSEIVISGDQRYIRTGGSEDTGLLQVETQSFSSEFRLPISNVGNIGDLYEHDPDTQWLLDAFPDRRSMPCAEIGDVMFFKYSDDPDDYS